MKKHNKQSYYLCSDTEPPIQMRTGSDGSKYYAMACECGSIVLASSKNECRRTWAMHKEKGI